MKKMKSLDMKRSAAFILIVFVTLLVVSCSKHSSGPNAGYGPNSLFPTTSGDTWYYVDSAVNDTGKLVVYPDTMVATKNAFTDASGMVYLEMNNPNGWFAQSYIAVDPSNFAVYEADSISGLQPYTMFALVSGTDGPIGTPYTDYTNASCPITYTQVGYVNPVQAYGYSCYVNTEVVVDCHQTLLQQTDYYLSAGVGVVRVDDFLTDTTGGVNRTYEDYSQTLTGKVLH
jgi:hypothetical protein